MSLWLRQAALTNIAGGLGGKKKKDDLVKAPLTSIAIWILPHANNGSM